MHKENVLTFHPALDGLTARQKRFVILRINFPLATRSALARAAGYREATITGDGGRTIKCDKIQRALREILLERSLSS